MIHFVDIFFTKMPAADTLLSWVVMATPAASSQRMIYNNSLCIADLERKEDENTFPVIRLSYNVSTHLWIPETTEALEAAISQAAVGATEVMVYQVFILLWPLLLYLGMLGVAIAFLLVFRGRANQIAGIPYSDASMSKEDALVYIFFYAAFGWSLSNGMILNQCKYLSHTWLTQSS